MIIHVNLPLRAEDPVSFSASGGILEMVYIRTPYLRDMKIDVEGTKGRDVEFPRKASSMEESYRRIFSRDPERRQRFLEYQERIFSEMEAKVKTGEMSAIKYHRIRRGIDQKELAMRMRTSQSYISKLEKPNANPERITLMKAAVALGINPKELLNE